MDLPSIKAFFGVPVLVQLKFPLAQVRVVGKSTIPYSDESDASQWIPEELFEEGSPIATQLVRYAVLHQLEEPGTLIEMVWATMGPTPNGAQLPLTVTIATLIDSRDIVAITRVVSVPEASLVVPKSQLILPGA